MWHPYVGDVETGAKQPNALRGHTARKGLRQGLQQVGVCQSLGPSQYTFCDLSWWHPQDQSAGMVSRTNSVPLAAGRLLHLAGALGRAWQPELYLGLPWGSLFKIQIQRLSLGQGN